MSAQNLTLLTDLYELTMMQGYFHEKDANETVISMPSTEAIRMETALLSAQDWIRSLNTLKISIFQKQILNISEV